MDLVADTSIFSQGELVCLNRYWHHKKIHSLGDLTQCNGITVDPVMYSHDEGTSYRKFLLNVLPWRTMEYGYVRSDP